MVTQFQPKIKIQPQLTIGQPNDRYEQEADAIADQVMQMPQSPPPIQRKCEDCEEEALQMKPLATSITPIVQMEPMKEEVEMIQAKSESGGMNASTSLSSQLNQSKGGGSGLPDATNQQMSSAFGTDFSGVRVHTDANSVHMNRSLGARAFTHGGDVYFNKGEYNPESGNGKHLLAHELTHVVQQGNNQSFIQRSWEIRPRATDNPLRSGGLTDEQLLENAFSEICPLTSRTGNIINVGAGPPTSDSSEGCRCLNDIEAAIGTPAMRSNPKVSVEPNGWSRTSFSGGALEVSVRHPDDPFSWGYWTGTSSTHATETRHGKPFWQTLAHEVCGHGATFARSAGARTGGRGRGTGHNEAIIGENLVAAEHGVISDEQRGMDVNPATGAPMPGHRGESFLEALIPDFAHADVTLPSSAASVISSVKNTINHTASLGLQLMIQVEGRAFLNEGGIPLATRRALEVRAQIKRSLLLAGISLTVGRQLRFHNDQTILVGGSSTSSRSNPERAVKVYLFHRAHSAAP